MVPRVFGLPWFSPLIREGISHHGTHRTHGKEGTRLRNPQSLFRVFGVFRGSPCFRSSMVLTSDQRGDQPPRNTQNTRKRRDSTPQSSEFIPCIRCFPWCQSNSARREGRGQRREASRSERMRSPSSIRWPVWLHVFGPPAGLPPYSANISRNCRRRFVPASLSTVPRQRRQRALESCGHGPEPLALRCLRSGRAHETARGSRLSSAGRPAV